MTKVRDWAIALGYVLFIYATLSIVGIPLKALREWGVLRIFLGSLYALIGIGILFSFYRKKLFQAWRILVLLSIFGLYLFVGTKVQSPEEQIHFIQYGLVGLFFYQALRHHLSKRWMTYLLAGVLASSAGWLDEVLQGITPNRHYDVNDIYLNVISAVLGLVIFRLFQRNSSSVPTP